MNIKKKTQSISRAVFFLLLAGVLAIGGIGYKMIESIRKRNKERSYSRKVSRLAVLDQQAQKYFRRAQEKILGIVQQLSYPCWELSL